MAAGGTKSASYKKSKKTVLNKVRPNSSHVFQDTPIYDLLKYFERAPDQWAARYILILSTIILKSAVGLGSYLGEGQLPIHGDFEAQRHWMEITNHLPVSQWYFFDLEYWGLDYPPLTAYHSYIFGKLGSFLNSSWFALNDSRGIENPGIKYFMRFLVIISDFIVYGPALLHVLSLIGKRFNMNRIDHIVFTAAFLCQPGLILIDNGHFQYNSVMLGLFLFAVAELIKENYILASIWFVLAINFKQMALYYAPFIFTYILASMFYNYYDVSKSFKQLIRTFNIAKLFLVGFTVLLTQFVLLLPFIVVSFENGFTFDILRQIVIRVFPFQRGLFEDKVANFWCTTNLVIKYREIFSLTQLTRLLLALTLASIIPPNLLIMWKLLMNKKFTKNSTQKIVILLLGFAITSWGFFLFSFQVHEKSVLVPLMPTLLLALTRDHFVLVLIQWIINVTSFSMYPLLKKDNLVLQYVTCLLISNWIMGTFNIKKNTLLIPKNSLFWKLIILSSYIAMFGYHVVDQFFEPPARYPDLWLILNTTISFAYFGIFWLWLLYRAYVLN